MAHQRNVEGLRQNAKRKKHEAIERTDKGINQLLEQGRPVNFKTVAETAGVSTAWLYQQSEIKERIEQLRVQANGAKVTSRKKTSGNSKEASIRVLEERIRELEAEKLELIKQAQIASDLALINKELKQELEDLKFMNAKLEDKILIYSASQSL